VSCDIADDRRRGGCCDVAVGVWSLGSVERVRVRSAFPVGGGGCDPKLRKVIEPVEHQVRLYLLDDWATWQVTVLSARVIGERQDFWIV
jgi:hypothetical protein